MAKTLGLAALCILGLGPGSEAQATLWRLSGPEGFKAGTLESLRLSPMGLELKPGARRGSFTSPIQETEPFSEAVVSWNADAPEGAGLRVEARVKVNGEWTGWAALFRWSQAAAQSLNPPPQGALRVAVDTLKIIGAKAQAFQVKLRFEAKEGGKTPTLHGITVAYYSPDSRAPFAAAPSPAWGKLLEIPRRSQGEEAADIRRRICSPTSLSMLLEHYGVRRPTAEVAARVYDSGSDLYGNWPFNTAYAAASDRSRIADAYVGRFSSLEELEKEILAGRPVVISHLWKEGELSNAPMPSTAGHLIVIVGFTPQGDVAANDPAGYPRSEVRRVYSRREIYRTWLVNGKGIVYLVAPRQ